MIDARRRCFPVTVTKSKVRGGLLLFLGYEREKGEGDSEAV